MVHIATSRIHVCFIYLIYLHLIHVYMVCMTTWSTSTSPTPQRNVAFGERAPKILMSRHDWWHLDSTWPILVLYLPTALPRPLQFASHNSVGGVLTRSEKQHMQIYPVVFMFFFCEMSWNVKKLVFFFRCFCKIYNMIRLNYACIIFDHFLIHQKRIEHQKQAWLNQQWCRRFLSMTKTHPPSYGVPGS